MKLNQMERTVVVSCVAVFLLATADGMEMTWVCPTDGPGICFHEAATHAQPAAVTPAEVSRPEGHIAKITSRIDVPAEQVGNAKEIVEAP